MEMTNSDTIFSDTISIDYTCEEEATISGQEILNKNKGSCAGGANTNYYGKQFEDKTNNLTRLLEQGFVKHVVPNCTTMFLQKETEDRTCVFVMQHGLKSYMKYKYNIVLFRCPDEAYIVESKYNRKPIVKILEKKEQNVNGSVETKLWSGPSLKREYEIVLGDKFEVHYAFCVNEFLQKKLCSSEKKYAVLKTILDENYIEVLFGDANDYFEKLDNWI